MNGAIVHPRFFESQKPRKRSEIAILKVSPTAIDKIVFFLARVYLTNNGVFRFHPVLFKYCVCLLLLYSFQLLVSVAKSTHFKWHKQAWIYLDPVVLSITSWPKFWQFLFYPFQYSCIVQQQQLSHHLNSYLIQRGVQDLCLELLPEVVSEHLAKRVSVLSLSLTGILGTAIVTHFLPLTLPNSYRAYHKTTFPCQPRCANRPALMSSFEMPEKPGLVLESKLGIVYSFLYFRVLATIILFMGLGWPVLRYFAYRDSCMHVVYSLESTSTAIQVSRNMAKSLVQPCTLFQPRKIRLNFVRSQNGLITCRPGT